MMVMRMVIRMVMRMVMRMQAPVWDSWLYYADRLSSDPRSPSACYICALLWWMRGNGDDDDDDIDDDDDDIDDDEPPVGVVVHHGQHGGPARGVGLPLQEAPGGQM